jgi:hypothetical protein
MIKKLLVLACVVVFAGCYKDTEEELYPNWPNPGVDTTGGCDTTDVSFATTIKPILDLHCAISGCHDAASAGNSGYDLSTYAGTTLSKDKIVGAIKQLSGYSAMPKGAPRLNNCEIAQISAWVAEGTKNN